MSSALVQGWRLNAYLRAQALRVAVFLGTHIPSAMLESPLSTQANGSSQTDGLPVPRRYWAILVQLTAIVMSVLDASIANVALPTIARELNATPADAVWVVNAYNVTLLVTMLPLSALSERVGIRRVFVVGLMIFTVASLLCALANSLLALTAARVLQGIGAAATMSVMAGLMRHIYPLPLLGRGIGLNAMIVGAAGAMGPTASSAILSVAEWPWLFAINVPIGLIALTGIRFLPDSQRVKTRFDGWSALLSGIMLTLMVIGLDRLVVNTGYSLVAIVIAFVLGFVILRRMRQQANPLWPIDLFTIRPFSYGLTAWLFLFASQAAVFVALPFYFQTAYGRGQVEVGLLMTAWPIFAVFVAPIAGRLADKHPSGILCSAGAGVMAAGLVLLLLLPADVSNVWIVAVMAISGTGYGFFHSPNNRSMLSSVPIQRSGAAGGMQGTTRTFGQSVGAALVAISFGISAAYGAKLALVLAVLCALGAVTVNLIQLRDPKARAVEEAARSG